MTRASPVRLAGAAGRYRPARPAFAGRRPFAARRSRSGGATAGRPPFRGSPGTAPTSPTEVSMLTSCPICQ